MLILVTLSYSEMCSAFDNSTGACVQRAKGPDTCWCERGDKTVYYVTYNVTARVTYSGRPLSLEGVDSIGPVQANVTFPVACSGFHPNCSRLIRDEPCTCRRLNATGHVYQLSYKKVADIRGGAGSVYLVWPGSPDIRSPGLDLPSVTGYTVVDGPHTRQGYHDSCLTRSHYTDTDPISRGRDRQDSNHGPLRREPMFYPRATKPQSTSRKNPLFVYAV
ncbi:hypothetical protein EGW08_011451 [Elysia chlorotica]|uniref:Thyroglobulin type-1 domain-containing protein n=1 Tax=Elysia chlorotica TaxID=188477 RepID=A0A433TGZ1_ELYCH|nr:hypothetical protein EGW08_011451 [Elysia chlorotica]